MSYLFTFCRLVLGLTFTFSFVSKARDIRQFTTTIANFDLLPRRWTKIAVLLFLSGEAAVVILMIVGGLLLPAGFALAGLLLLLFTLAILSALRRNIHTFCNCFGASVRPLTYYDVWRNAGFMACSLVGWRLIAQAPMTESQSTWAEMGLLAFLAALFVMVWTQLNQVAMLLAKQE